jgi:hypothetical protein
LDAPYFVNIPHSFSKKAKNIHLVNINKCIPDCTKEDQKYKHVIEYKNQCVENCNSLDDGYELKESNGKCFKKCLEERKYFNPDSNECDNKCDRTKYDRYEVSSLTVNYVCKKSCSIKNKYRGRGAMCRCRGSLCSRSCCAWAHSSSSCVISHRQAAARRHAVEGLKNGVCVASCSNNDRIGKGNECKSGCDDEQDGKYYYNI